jgi:branched-chain amino acid transport system permease protein
MSKVRIAGGSVLALLLAFMPLLVNNYVLQIFLLTITYAILGLSFALTLKVGLPRFDVAAWWGVGAYTTAMLMLKTGMSFWLATLIGGAISVLLGWLVFSVAIPRGMMVFLLFGMVLVLAFQQLFGTIPFFGGWGGTEVTPQPTIGSFTFANKTELYYMGLFFLGVTVVVYRLLYNSKIGRAWNAVGSSVKLASSLGINVVRYRLANVLIGNFFIAIAGSYLVAYTLVAVPDTFSFANSVYVMMYVVVGGLTHVLVGPLIGAVVITFIPEYLRVAKQFEPIITAVAIILIIILLPYGFLGFYDRRVKPWFVRKGWQGTRPDRQSEKTAATLLEIGRD